MRRHASPVPIVRGTPGAELPFQRVLVVDDDPGSRRLTRAILAGEGLRDFREAADGQAALEACGPFRPDVVILDLQMPGMDGQTALPRLRKLLPDATLIVVSGVPDLDAARLRALGASACIPKTCSSAEFVARFRSALHGT